MDVSLFNNIFNPHSLNNILLGILLVVLAVILWRRSLSAIASLVLIAVAYIVERGAPFINSWLAKSSGNLTGLQAIVAIRVTFIIVLPIFVLVVLKHVAKRVPIIIRILSAAVFSALLFWYTMQSLLSVYTLGVAKSTSLYEKLQQGYPVLLLAALVLAGLELWFAYSAGSTGHKSKSHKH